MINAIKAAYYDTIEDWALSIREDNVLGRKVRNFVYKNAGIYGKRKSRRCHRRHDSDIVRVIFRL